MMANDVITKPVTVVAERPMLVPELEEAPVGDTAREEELAASKQNKVAGRKD